MPRGSGSKVTPAMQEQRRLLWAMTGQVDGGSLRQWDPKSADFLEAVLDVLSTGAAVFMRPGSGGRAIGIAIWEGDVRHPAKWLYEAAEMDDWSHMIMKAMGGDISQVAD